MKTNRFLLFTAIIVLLVVFGVSISYADTPNIFPSARYVIQSSDSVDVPFLIYNAGKTELSSKLSLACQNGKVDSNIIEHSLLPGESKIFTARVSLDSSCNSSTLLIKGDGAVSRVGIVRGIDLAKLPWKRVFTKNNTPHDVLAVHSKAGEQITPPCLWNENDNAWCSVRVTVPQEFNGRRLRLIIGAVDDNDITYFNGKEIGRTKGWNKKREYEIPQNLIRWGSENTITVMVDNIGAGGGLTQAPLVLLCGDSNPAEATTDKSLRPKPGKVGSAYPFRPIHVENGVLRYPDETEVALWGTNYHPQSWYQYKNMTRLCADMKTTIRRDLDDMKKMGVQVVRVHVFDREISDGNGNIIQNIHLDLLDYLISECSKRGMYFFLTNVAWWGSPYELKDSFSAQTSKPGMMFAPEAIEAASDFTKQLLTHVNKYTGRQYRDEPCICLYEVQNEPAYFTYLDTKGAFYSSAENDPVILERDRERFRVLWQNWLTKNKLQDTPGNFSMFRYELMRSYIQKMVEAIRSTGAKQPVAMSCISVFPGDDDLIQAIADSECDAIAINGYKGAFDKCSEGVNLLPDCGPIEFDPRLTKKARLAYEFDSIYAIKDAYMYPAIAASFRSGEVQVACQFQYDSISTAKWNADWLHHWLNLLYTPERSVSFMIGSETFSHLPRGITYAVPKTELKLNYMATSFSKNLCEYADPDVAMYNSSTNGWEPITFPKNPKRIVGVGSSRYAYYSGSGIYTIEKIGWNTLRITINPDAEMTGVPLNATTDLKPAVELKFQENFFSLKLPGWTSSTCTLRNTATNSLVPATNGGWTLKPGIYILKAKK